MSAITYPASVEVSDYEAKMSEDLKKQFETAAHDVAKRVVKLARLTHLERGHSAREDRIRKGREVGKVLAQTPEGREVMKRALLTTEEREAAAALAAPTLKANPQQPRNRHGKWRSSIVGLEVATPPSAPKPQRKTLLPWRNANEYV